MGLSGRPLIYWMGLALPVAVMAPVKSRFLDFARNDKELGSRTDFGSWLDSPG
jgi:hypothetical protein